MKHVIFTILAITALVGCNNMSTTDCSVAEIEKTLAAGDYEAVQDMCEDFVADSAMGEKSISELCRLSVVMMKLTELIDDETATIQAVECCRVAFDKDALSAECCYDSLATEEAAIVAMLQTLAASVGRQYDIPSDEEIDSLMNEAEQALMI